MFYQLFCKFQTLHKIMDIVIIVVIDIVWKLIALQIFKTILTLNTFCCWKVILVIHGFANSSEVVSPGSGAGITWFGQIAGVIFRWAESYLGLSRWTNCASSTPLSREGWPDCVSLELADTDISTTTNIVDRPTQLWFQQTNTNDTADTDISTKRLPWLSSRWWSWLDNKVQATQSNCFRQNIWRLSVRQLEHIMRK